jgi:hypothetical protein
MFASKKVLNSSHLYGTKTSSLDGGFSAIWTKGSPSFDETIPIGSCEGMSMDSTDMGGSF